MRQRIIRSGSMNEINHPEIVSKKMEKWLQKYSKNLQVVRCSEEILSNQTKKIFYIDDKSQTVLGNIQTRDSGDSDSKLLDFSLCLLSVFNMVLTLILSSFKLGSRTLSAKSRFDNRNLLNKESLYYSESNYSVHGVENPENRSQTKIIRISLFLVLKLFFALKIIREFGTPENTETSPLASMYLFFMVIVAEILLKHLKTRIEKILKLEVNFVQTQAYIREPKHMLGLVFPEKDKGNRKQNQRLVDEINMLRIAGNVKKDFVLNYFTKNVKNLMTDFNALDSQKKDSQKVFTGYRNEDMMTKKNGVFEYTSSGSHSGIFCLLLKIVSYSFFLKMYKFIYTFGVFSTLNEK